MSNSASQLFQLMIESSRFAEVNTSVITIDVSGYRRDENISDKVMLIDQRYFF